MKSLHHRLNLSVFITLKPLSDEDSWSLFVNFVFGGQNPSSYPELEDIGRQIMESVVALL